MVRRPIFTSKASRGEYQFLGPVRFLWGREQAHGPIGAKLKDFQFSTRLAPVKEPMDILLYLLFIFLFTFLLRLLLTTSVHFLFYLNRISSKAIIYHHISSKGIISLFLYEVIIYFFIAPLK